MKLEYLKSPTGRICLRQAICTICVGAIIGFAMSVHADDTSSSVISVNAASSPGPANHRVLGGNTEAADGARIFSSNTTDVRALGTANGFWDPQSRAPVPAVLDRTRQAGLVFLRYPGGSLVHNYDWRKAVGPLETRGIWTFGVDEYLALCKAMGAEPVITVSDYVLPADQMPANAAGLVEYLNAPATPDHPWAMKRKEWGHPDPYGVKMFELGNESAEGNMRVLPRRCYTAEQYAAYANATAAAMKAVDPTIKLGIVMMPSPGTDVECAWNQTVVQNAGKSADYLIVHLYGPDISKMIGDTDFFQGCMAYAEQSEKHLDEYRALARSKLGHELPITITEYNGPLDEPRAADRYSYGVAFQCADLIRIFLKPEHEVLGANYWQFLNGAFGMIHSDLNAPGGGTLEEKPAFALYSLWAAHLGSRLVDAVVSGPRASYKGAGSVYPATGDAYLPPKSLGELPTNGRLYVGQPNPGVTVEGGTGGAFSLKLQGVTGSVYPPLALLPQPSGSNSCTYKISYEARYTPDPGSSTVGSTLGLGVGDSRGWNLTRSMIGIEGVGADWKPFRAEYHGLPDTTAISLQGRLQAGGGKLSGQLEVRNLKIEVSSNPQFPAYSLLTATASLSDDGQTLHLVVFNKSADKDISSQIKVAGFNPASAKVWEVNGPSFAAVSGVAETVHGFPAHSMTAIDFVTQSKPTTP
jgi:alpha-N-arabinofuranosidase